VNKCFIFFILLFLNRYSIAAEDYYKFNSHKDQQRFASLTSELRCLVCQNQTLAESNSPLAEDLRNQIYIKINSGQTDKNITDYLISRYGNFISYRPPLDSSTVFLWFGPFIIFIFGIFYLFYIIKKNKQ